jgi:hypothetical protein
MQIHNRLAKIHHGRVDPDLLTPALQSYQVLDQRRYWDAWIKRSRLAHRTIKAETDYDPDEPVEVDFSRFTPDKYLLSWATIVGGVEPDENGYYIVPAHGKWVNDNGNAWFNQVVLESYKSFIWAENYLEHVQVPELSKGKILDAVAWVVREHERGVKELIPTVFVDILVATNKKKHPRLAKSILDRRMTGLSMGCNITHSQCSACGKIFEEGEQEPCRHIRAELLAYFRGEDGKKHRKAEMCGVPGEVGTCLYSEASWVAIPAFKHALRHDSLRVGDAWLHKPLKAIIPRGRLKEAATED